MIERFYREMQRLVDEPSQYRYLLTVSGGADSVVLAHLFHQNKLSFTIAHCNFHLRGEESNRDMHFVQLLASSLQVPCLVQEFDTLALQKGSGQSIEMLARSLRYEWFAAVGKEYDYIVTAHHANDALETTLLNLCRGTGLRGLASIPEQNGKIIRPLLSFSAAEIRRFAQVEHINFVVDSTNSEESIRRNKIRHTLVPILETLNPNLIQTYSRSRRILQEQHAFFQRSLQQSKAAYLTEENGQFVIDIVRLEQNPDKNILLYELLNDFGFSAAIVEELKKKKSIGTQFFSKEYSLLVDREKYIIQQIKDDSKEERYIDSMEELKRYFKVTLCSENTPVKFSRQNTILYIPEAMLTFPLTLRHWQEGDIFHPLGAKGKQKLSDFFINRKIDLFAKKKVWLLCDRHEIIWIVGHRSNEKYKMDKNKKSKYFKIECYGMEESE